MVQEGKTAEMIRLEREEKRKKLEVLAELEKSRKSAEAFDLPVGTQGYLDEVPVNKNELTSVDWSRILDKALVYLDKMASLKKPDDIVLYMTEMALLAPLDMLTNWLEQKHATYKQNIKTLAANRRSFIENNLKSNNLTMTSLAAQLSKQVQNWLLNDKEYQILPENGPYNKHEKAIIQKRDFALKLPKTADGNIDFGKMSHSQKRRYATYVALYARSPKWWRYACEMSGVKLAYDEYKKLHTTAVKLHSVRLPQTVLTR